MSCSTWLAEPITRLVGEQALLVTEKVFGRVVAIAVGGMASALVVLFPVLGNASST